MDAPSATSRAATAHLQRRRAGASQLLPLATVLKMAVEWGDLERPPCRIRLLKTSKATVSFYEPEEYLRLVEAASTVSTSTRFAVVLGGDAGLRLGEKRMMAEVQRAAGLEANGRVHVLRHTFGARLAIEGAPPKAIQES